MVPILRPCASGEDLQLRAARHAAVFLEDLDDHRGGLQAGQPRQIATGLGVACPHQDPTGLGHQREDVPGLHQILRARRPGLPRPHGGGPVGGGNPRGDPLSRLDGDGEIGGVRRIVVRYHQRQAQALAALPGQGQTHQAATVAWP